MSRTTFLPWRLAAGIVSGAAFLVLAGLVRPDRTRAADLAPPPSAFEAPGPRTASAVPGAELPPPQAGSRIDASAPLGRIEGRRYTVEILAAEGEPLYLLRDADTNEPLGVPMTAESFSDRYPDLAPEALLTDHDAAIMRHVDRHDDLR